MKCPHARDKLVDYIYSDLPAAEKEAVKAHLEECPACAKEAASLKGVLAMYRNADLGSPSDETVENILAASGSFNPESFKKTARVGNRIVAALLVAGFIGFILHASYPVFFSGPPEKPEEDTIERVVLLGKKRPGEQAHPKPEEGTGADISESSFSEERKVRSNTGKSPAEEAAPASSAPVVRRFAVDSETAGRKRLTAKKSSISSEGDRLRHKEHLEIRQETEKPLSDAEQTPDAKRKQDADSSLPTVTDKTDAAPARQKTGDRAEENLPSNTVIGEILGKAEKKFDDREYSAVVRLLSPFLELEQHRSRDHERALRLLARACYAQGKNKKAAAVLNKCNRLYSRSR